MTNVRNFGLDSNILFASTMFGEEEIYAVQSVELPGINANHQQENTKYGIVNLQADVLEYNPIEVILIVDENLNVWKKIISILQQYQIVGTNNCTYREDNAWIEIRDNNNNYLFKVDLFNVYIRSIANLEYSTIKENETLVLRLTLNYDYFTIS